MTTYYKLYKKEHDGKMRYVDKHEDSIIMGRLGEKLLKKAKERVITGPRHYVPTFHVYKCIEEETEVIK